MSAGRRPRHGSRRRRHRSGAPVEQAVADRLPHDRSARARPISAARKRPTARRSATPRSPRHAQNIGWPHAPFEVPDDIVAAWRDVAERGKAARRAWEQRLAARRSAKPSRARSPASCRTRSSTALDAFRKEHVEKATKVATRKASEMALGVDQRRNGSDRRRLGRPDPFQPDHHQGHEPRRARRLCRQLHPLRHPRARHGGGDERHRAAWRLHSLWRHVPVLCRLCARRDAALGADAPAGHLRDDA